MACTWNKPEGCTKPDEAPCPQEVLINGDLEAGVGEKMKRTWKKK